MAERPPIRGARVAAGLSLRELAARVELDHVTLGEIERGLRSMTLEERARVYETICAAADAQQTRKGVDLGARLLARRFRRRSTPPREDFEAGPSSPLD